MAIAPAAPDPLPIDANRPVLIHGRVLREIRQHAGLRLLDLAGGRGPISRLSRLERQHSYPLTASVLNHLLRALGISATFTDADTGMRP